MQSIHIGRYEQPNGFAGWVEPEDRSWVLFVATDGSATLYNCVGATTDGPDAERVYMPAGQEPAVE
jgi:hypothetical protein